MMTPDQAKLVTVDIDNFWSAYALASAASTPEEKEQIYQRECLDKGEWAPALESGVIPAWKSSRTVFRKHC